jgi:hypothetical protein
MKIGHTKQVFAVIFLLAVLSPQLLDSTKALSFNYSDNFLSVFSVSSSSDVAKPGNTLTATITGRLSVTGQAVNFSYCIFRGCGFSTWESF